VTSIRRGGNVCGSRSPTAADRTRFAARPAKLGRAFAQTIVGCIVLAMSTVLVLTVSQLPASATNAGPIFTLAGGDGPGPRPATSMAMQPTAVAAADVDGTPYVYVADESWNVVRRLSLTTGDETVVAGIGGSVPGYKGDGGAATSAELDDPTGLAVDSAGDLVIADAGNDRVRFVPASTGTYFGQSMTAGDIYTIAGDGNTGFEGDGAPGPSAELDDPSDVAVDALGNVYIADTDNVRLRFVSNSGGTDFGQSMTAGDIYTIAGGGSPPGNGNGIAPTSATLYYPAAVAVDGAGDIYIANTDDNDVRFIPTVTGTYYGQSMSADEIYTIAGDGTSGFAGDTGPATSAELARPDGLSVDSSGDVFVADTGNDRVREIPSTGGTYFDQSMAADDIYTIAGTGATGYSGDSGVATSAKLSNPESVAVDASGDVVIADVGNVRVRAVAASTATNFGQSMTDGDIYTIAGGASTTYSGDGGPAAGAALDGPHNLAVDPSGDLFIADTSNNRVRMVAASTGTFFGQSMIAGDIYTVAGDGSVGSLGDGGPSASAELSAPQGVATDSSGNLYIADTGNGRIRFVPSSSGTFFGESMTGGDIYTIAGDGSTTESLGDPATSSGLNYPENVAVDSNGGVYMSTSNDGILYIPATTTIRSGVLMVAGYLYSVAGAGTPQSLAVDADGDIAFAGGGNIFFLPLTSGTYFGQSMIAGDPYTVGYAVTTDGASVAFDSSGNLYFSSNGGGVSTFNNFVGVVMRSSGQNYVLAGNGNTDYAGDGEVATAASIEPSGIAVNSTTGDLYIDDSLNKRIYLVALDFAAPSITSSPNTTFTAGTYGYFDVATSGYPQAEISEVGTMPAGMQIDSPGDVLYGTPSAGSGGVYPIAITASNGVGSTVTQSFMLTVNQAPAITSTSSATFDAEAAGSFSVAASGFPSPTFSESGALPLGVTFDTDGALSGTPASGTSGSYPIAITASNGVGSGATQQFLLSVDDVPSAPTAVDAVGKNGQASVSWNAPVSDGGSPITEFRATASPGGSSCSTVSTSCVVTGLSNGTEYTFTVTATNALGAGASSTPSNAVTPATVASVPTAVVASAGNGEATVSWSGPSSNGGSLITGYVVTSSPGGIICSTTATSCTASGLVNGAAYTFSVRAINAVGSSSPSSASNSVTPLEPSPSSETTRTAAPEIGVLTTTYTVSKGVVPVRVSCAEARCSGVAELTQKVRVSIKGHKSATKTVILARRAFDISDARAASVNLSLSASGTSAFRHASTHHVGVTLHITVAGGKTVSRAISIR
jgi:trimeric autotransporter adhesin